jgi:hypothetical protein
MHRPWLTPIVIVFWCLTTGWLVVAKILPSLLPGSPPGYQAIYSANGGLIPVAWTVLWKEQSIGWAVSDSERDASGQVTVETALKFDRLPIEQLLPAMIKPWMGRVLGRAAPVDVEARGTMLIDPRGQLQEFRSVVELPGGVDRVVLDGTVDDGHITIRLRSGGLSYETSRYLPSNAAISDALSPQATMPGLATGQRWTVPVCNPLRGGNGALEVMYAEVAAEETLFWNDRLVRVDLVVYRDDPSEHHEPSCRIWVDRGGRVLKQESGMFGGKLTFLRRSDEAAADLVKSMRDADARRAEQTATTP